MGDDSLAATYDQLFRWLQRIARMEIRRELARRPQSPEPIYLAMPHYSNGAPPLFHLSDDDVAWQQDETERAKNAGR